MADNGGWLDLLRPNDLAAARMRQAIMEAARPLLAARRDSWFDVASRWAALVTPVAAVLTLVFAGLAIRQGVPSDSPAVARGEFADFVDSEVVPAAFTSEFDDTADIVFAALGDTAEH